MADTTADVTMSSADFEALMVLPTEDSAENFEVSYSVTSYEVDDTGAVQSGVEGAVSTDSVTVYVEAVTDPATLLFDASVEAADVENADAIAIDTDATTADVTLSEDTTVNVADILAASLADMDGSEVRSVTITNNTGTDIVVNGETIADGENVTIDAAGLSDDASDFSDIQIGGTDDFSGDLEGITITFNSQDVDADGYLEDGTEVSGSADGVEEADTSDNSVTLNLYVTPVAGDVSLDNVEGTEDSAISFLSGLSVSDSSTDSGGSELISAISFEVPTDWEITASTVDNAAADGATITQDGSTYTITFTSGTEAEREAWLDGFTITPPSQDSSDATVTLSVTTADTQVVNGVEETSTETTDLDLVITVTPEAETVGNDSDGDGVDDLTMNDDFSYSTSAQEDTWLDLNSDNFDLAEGWSNQDDSEVTYALLTPVLIDGDGAEVDATGSQFSWTTDDGEVVVETYVGTAIEVPVSALDTLQFKATDDFSGEFSITVEAYTVDYDDDGEVGDADTSTAVSGSATLSNVLVTPVADEVTLSLTARANGDEDETIPLVINPTSSDSSETFNVTISDIPDGAVLTYDGTVLTVTDGSVTIEDFDSTATFTIVPPENSNADFTLTVNAVSVDTFDNDGTIYSDTSDGVSPFD